MFKDVEADDAVKKIVPKQQIHAVRVNKADAAGDEGHTIALVLFTDELDEFAAVKRRVIDNVGCPNFCKMRGQAPGMHAEPGTEIKTSPHRRCTHSEWLNG